MRPLIKAIVHEIKNVGERNVFVGSVDGDHATLAAQAFKIESSERRPATNDETPFSRPGAISHDLVEWPEGIPHTACVSTVFFHELRPRSMCHHHVFILSSQHVSV